MAPVILRDTDGDLISSAAPAGSTSYYCIRFAPASLRDHLMAVNAWRTLIRGTLAQVSDAGVATRKLAWWHDELDRIIAHRGTHPLAGPLGSAIAFASLPREPFIDILWAAEALIVNRKISDFSALLAWARQDLGALCELDARIQGKQGSKPLDLARTAGAYSSLVELIRDSGWLTRRGHTRFLPTLAAIPSAMGLAATGARADTAGLNTQGSGRAGPGATGAGITPLGASLACNAEDPPELDLTSLPRRCSVLAETDLMRLRRALDGALDELPVSVRIRVRLMDQLLDELAGSAFAVADQSIDLTPIRKLWHAWRAHRSAAASKRICDKAASSLAS